MEGEETSLVLQMSVYDTDPHASIGDVKTSEVQQPDPSGARAEAAGLRTASEALDPAQLVDLGARLAGEAVDPEREARLARIAALYEAGTYEVDAGAVSERIVDDSTVTR